MKIEKIILIEELDLKEAFNDPFIFAMDCHYQDKKYDYSVFGDKEPSPNDIPKELRCSCRPVCSMTAKSLKDICNNPDKYVIIRIDPEMNVGGESQT